MWFTHERYEMETLHVFWLHKLTQSMGSKGCVFVKCQSLPSYLLCLVSLVIFLQTECITEGRGKKVGKGRLGRGLIRRTNGKGIYSCKNLFCTNTKCLP